MTLALGDALAVALMEHRAFTPEDFAGLHPGGRLGARLAKVADLMHAGDEVPLIGAGGADGRGADRDERARGSAWWASSTRTARWSGSSPTATSGGTWRACSSGGWRR